MQGVIDSQLCSLDGAWPDPQVSVPHISPRRPVACPRGPEGCRDLWIPRINRGTTRVLKIIP